MFKGLGAADSGVLKSRGGEDSLPSTLVPESKYVIKNKSENNKYILSVWLPCGRPFVYKLILLKIIYMNDNIINTKKSFN